MLLTPEQVQAIQQVIENHHSAFIVNAISPDAVPPEVLQKLKDLGLVDPKVESIKDAYLYGQLLGILENKTVANMSYDQFQKYVKQNPVPLTEPEKQGIKFAALNAAQYCRGLGNKVSLQTGDVLIEADQKLRAEMETTIKNETMLNVARRESVKDLKSNLGWATKDWARDWTRIAVTEKQNAMQHGLGDHYRKKHGKDVLVAKRPMPDACKHCKRLHIGPDGQPRIFKLSTLEANGTNVGRKANDWLPVVGTVHPHCQCQMVRVPEGWGFNEEGDLVPGGEYGERYENEAEMEMALREELELEKAFQIQDNIVFQGIPIAIENRKHSTRKWKDADGNTGETKLTHAYGYVKRTKGADGDEIDVFVGPDPRAQNVFIIHQQNKKQGTYDEEKVMLGFSNQKEAEAAYRENFDVPEDFFLTTSPMSVEAFKRYASVTMPKQGEMMKSRKRGLSHVIPFSGTVKVKDQVKLIIPTDESLEKGKLDAELGAATYQPKAPGPGLGVNFLIPPPASKQERRRTFEPAFKPEELKAEEDGVHEGDPLKKKKSDYEIKEPVPVVPRPVKVPKEWEESQEQAREGAEERKEQFILRYQKNKGEANSPLEKGGKQLPIIAIGKKGGKIVGYDKKGKPIYQAHAGVLAVETGGHVESGTKPGTVAVKVPKSQKHKLIDFQKEHNLPGHVFEGGVNAILIVDKKFIAEAKSKPVVKVTPATVEFAKEKQKRSADMTVVANVEDLEAPYVDPSHMFRGEEVTVATKSGIVSGTIEGTDQAGDPIVNAGGKRIIVGWDKVKTAGDVPKPYRATTKKLPPGAVVSGTQRQVALMRKTIDELKVCGEHTASEFVAWLWNNGQESFVVGGLVRDLLESTKPGQDVSNEQILELMKDVDIVTPADPHKTDKMMKSVGSDVMEFYNDGGQPWGVLRFVGGGVGLDVASVAQDGMFDKTKWNDKLKREAPPAVMDHDLVADCNRRDFTCNAVYFDAINNVFVDPTTKGIADAQNRVLRLASDLETAAKNESLPLRYFKFRMRGYKPTKETHAFCVAQFEKLMKTHYMATDKAKAFWKNYAAKGGDPEVHMAKLKEAMKEDGILHVWEKYIEPQLPEILAYMKNKAKSKG